MNPIQRTAPAFPSIMSKSRTLRLLLWVNLWLALSAAVSAAQVALSSYAFSPLTPPIISTDEPMPQTYKLRAKFIGVPGYVDGYHAATSWQNNGYQLDMLPGAGTWTVALYWLKYNDSGSTLLEVGPTQNVTVVVGVGAVGLSASYFAPSQRPTISTGDPMPARYRLFAHFDDGSPAGFEAATAWNNNAMLLDGLPPEGTYPVTLYWRKYDATGTSVTEAGPQLQDQVTISSQPTSLLNTAGYIWSEETFDEETGDPTGTNYSSSDYSVTVSMAGQLTVYTTGETDTYGAVWGPGASAGADTGGDHPNFSVTITVVPGDYSINVGGNSGGEYQVHAIFTPPQLTGNPPVVTSAGSASGMPGLAFSYNVTATNSPTAFTASGLPPGLSINGSTGAITGMPVQGSGTYYVTLHAANATAGLGPAYVVAFNLTKGSQNITFGSLANKTYGNAPFALTATASSGLPVTYSVLDGPATVAGSTVTLVGEGAVTIRAAQAGNSNYNAAVSVDRSFVVGALTPVRVALQYWQPETIQGFRPMQSNANGWKRPAAGGATILPAQAARRIGQIGMAQCKN